MSSGTAIPTATEWPALRAAWGQGTIAWCDLITPGMTPEHARVVLSRMTRAGLLARVALGSYTATHSRAAMAAYVLGEE